MLQLQRHNGLMPRTAAHIDPKMILYRPSCRKTILVTGLSGLLGQAMLNELVTNFNIIALVRQRRGLVPDKNFCIVIGDVTQPTLGLNITDYTSLVDRIDAILHLAAITDFQQPLEKIYEVNVEGTKNIVNVALEAQVPLHYVSTAFVALQSRVALGDATSYERSKIAAESVVRESSVKGTILRPSIITGHSVTGQISAFQGFYFTLGLVLKGTLPILPASQDSFVDFIPHDFLSEIITKIVKHDLKGDYWLTLGDRALKLHELIAFCLTNAERLVGSSISPPKMVSPDVFERLILPVFFAALPHHMKRTLGHALELARYFGQEEPLPSSVQELTPTLALREIASPRELLASSAEYWASKSSKYIQKK